MTGELLITNSHFILYHRTQKISQARECDVRKTPLGRTRSNVPPPKESQHTLVSKSRSVDNVGTSYHYAQPQQQQQQQENLHKKLQRQLTLNPNSDPRLTSNRRYLGPPMPGSPGGQMSPVTPSYVGHPGWDMHQHVTRIASAPDSYRPWPPQQHHQQR